ncbi:MAG: Gfo/Idh/MocA family oxidoreductase [Candidatus Coatesbacteria bacterium]
METLKLGYVGAGYLAQRVHLPNLCSLPQIELAALAEVRPKLGKRIQEKFRIPRLYADHLALAADPAIRAVMVSGHFIGQGEIARDLLLAGKDVLMEKPMAVSVEQGERILEAERKSGKRLMVAYMKRYDSGNLKVKALIAGYAASGELGAIRYVRQHGFCGDWVAGLDTPFEGSDEPVPAPPKIRPAWMPEGYFDRYVGYLQQYTHNVNLVRFLLGAGDRAVVKHVDLDSDGMHGVVILEVAGVRTIVESGSVAYHAWDEHTTVYFDRGWVRTHAPPLLQPNRQATVETYVAGKDGPVAAEHFAVQGWPWAFKEELKHFAECLTTGAPFRSPAADAVVDVRTLEEIYRQFVKASA